MNITIVGTDTELSLSEIRVLALKAARGAGMSWGLAEEAGFAVEWLTARSLPGASWLAALLQRKGRGGPAWPAVAVGAGGCCPITTGATLADHALATGDAALPCELRLRAVASPGLLLPFAARLAALRQAVVLIGAGDDPIAVSGDPRPGEIGNARAWAAGQRDVTLVIGDRDEVRPAAAEAAARRRALLSAADLDCLNGLAARLTVPATALSRRDAGGAMSDND